MTSLSKLRKLLTWKLGVVLGALFMVSAVAVGKVDDRIVTDLTYEEESYEEGPVTDIPVAMLYNTKDITLLQMDGEISKEDLHKALELARDATTKIAEIQIAALKQRYARQQAGE